ncbi:MAG: hypothetical protein ACMV0F_06080 [Trichlorobacter sp.]
MRSYTEVMSQMYWPNDVGEIPYVPMRENQLNARLLGAGSCLNSWIANDSASRVQMFNSQVGQSLVLKDSTPRVIQTGMEREYGKHTFKKVFKEESRVVRNIEKYPRRAGDRSIKLNPVTTIIYEECKTHSFNVLHLERYHTQHQSFGFKYRHNTKIQQMLSPNAPPFPPGTILADSPSVRPDGEYCYGIETRVAFMSIPQVIEDGVVVTDEYLKRLTSTGTEERRFSFGKEFFPLNLYGDKDNYKPFPDIGDKIRDDGLVFALRQYDPINAAVEMTPEALMQPDYIFDKLTYGEPGAEVYDIDVFHDPTQKKSPTPFGMAAQCQKYFNLKREYHEEILKEYSRLRKQYGVHLKMTPEFRQLVVEAQATGPRPDGKRVQLTRRAEPLDDWHVTLKYAYDIIPTIGYKVTDTHGGKGVICDIIKVEHAPRDIFGRVADMILDGDSRIKRMNKGSVWEHYLLDSVWHARNYVVQLYGSGSDQEVDAAYAFLFRYYYVVSPYMGKLVGDLHRRAETTGDIKAFKRGRVEAVINDKIYIHLPPDSPNIGAEGIRAVQNFFPIVRGPLTYKPQSSDDFVTTVNPIRIGGLYILLLEKTGGDWSAVSLSKLNHYGLHAKLTNADKFSNPCRKTPVRLAGEAENRLFASTMGGPATAEFLERSGNPELAREINKNVHRGYAIDGFPLSIVDREKIPGNKRRGLVYVNHINYCAGMRLTYDKICIRGV